MVVDDEGQEEEAFEDSFAVTGELRAHGVQAADISRLEREGYTSVGLIAAATSKKLGMIKGLSAERVKFIREKALVVDPSAQATFRSALEIKQIRLASPKI